MVSKRLEAAALECCKAIEELGEAAECVADDDCGLNEIVSEAGGEEAWLLSRAMAITDPEKLKAWFLERAIGIAGIRELFAAEVAQINDAMAKARIEVAKNVAKGLPIGPLLEIIETCREALEDIGELLEANVKEKTAMLEKIKKAVSA